MDYNKSGKFGLIIKKKEDNNKKVKSFVDNFKDEEDDDEEYLNRDDKSNKFDYKKEINKNIQKQGMYNMIRQSEEMSKNLLQDPNFYEYDAVYDDMTNSQKNKKRDNTRDNADTLQPKYLGAILAATEKRKIEQSIVKERVERIKREREVGEYGDKPKFVTREYEEKIKIDKKRELVAKLDEKYNEKNTVNSEFGMMGFYSNLLTKNVAYGGINKIDENEEVVTTYKDKIKQYENSIENYKEQKDVIKDKEVKENNITIEKDKLVEKEKQEEGIKSNSKEKVDLEEYKKRYLERKRNRPME